MTIGRTGNAIAGGGYYRPRYSDLYDTERR
jgi:hypothetical protein